MALIKTAEQIKQGIPTMECQKAADDPENRLGHLQYAILVHLRTRPHWVADRDFWLHLARHHGIRLGRVHKAVDVLAESGLVYLSERNDPRMVTAPPRGKR